MVKFILFIVLAIFISAAFLFGFYEGRQEVRKDAIKHGVAHWEVSLDGWPVFTWDSEKK